MEEERGEDEAAAGGWSGKEEVQGGGTGRKWYSAGIDLVESAWLALRWWVGLDDTNQPVPPYPIHSHSTLSNPAMVLQLHPPLYPSVGYRG